MDNKFINKFFKIFTLGILVAVVAAGFYIAAERKVLYLPGRNDFEFRRLVKDIPKVANQPADTLVTKSLPLHQWQTAQGTKVFFYPTENLPIVDIKFSFHAGSAFDEAKPGLAYLTKKLLLEGTHYKSAEDIANSLDMLGAICSTSVSRDTLNFTVRSLTDEKVITNLADIITDVLLNPAFPAPAVTRVKDTLSLGIKEQQNLPGFIVRDEFFKVIYGQHPYAQSTEGNLTSISNISRADIHEFHQKYFTAKNMVVTIVGGIHRDVAKNLVAKIIAALPPGDKSYAVPAINTQVIAAEKHIPLDSTQAHILMGKATIKVDTSDRIALQLGNYSLGGSSLTSRLGEKIRNDSGLAYTVASSLHPLQAEGPFLIKMQTKTENAKEAIAMVKKISREYIKRGPTQDELNIAKQNLIADFDGSFTSNKHILELISNIAIYDLDPTVLDNYKQNINDVKPQDVQAALKKHLDVSKMSLVVAGIS